MTSLPLLRHWATQDLQLQDRVDRKVTLNPCTSAVMALLRTASDLQLWGTEYRLHLLLDIQCVLQENVNNLKRKFQQCCAVIRAQLVITVQELPVRESENRGSARASLHLPQGCQHSSSMAKLSCNRLWLLSRSMVSA